MLEIRYKIKQYRKHSGGQDAPVAAEAELKFWIINLLSERHVIIPETLEWRLLKCVMHVR